MTGSGRLTFQAEGGTPVSEDDLSFRSACAHEPRVTWGRALSNTHLPWDITGSTADSAAGFGATVRRRHLVDLIFLDCSCDPCSGVRCGHEISQTTGEYLVMLMTLEGREIVSEGDRQAQLEPGNVVVCNSSTPAAFEVQEPLVKRSLLVPKKALSEVGSRGELMTGSVLDADAPAVLLLRGFLDGLSKTIDMLPAGALPAARNATIELLAAALQAPGNPMPESSVATRSAAEAFIERNIREFRLSPASVADAIGVSVRSLHRAFEDSDDTVSGYIRVRRLARSRDDLAAGSSVSQVARRWHYTDASNFSRAFKRHYGYNPRDQTRILARP